MSNGKQQIVILAVALELNSVLEGNSMNESSFAGKVRQPAHLSGELGCMALPVSTDYEADWATVSSLLDYSSHTYTKTWDDATSKTLMEGGYIGNGDFGAHLGGTIHSLKYYLGKNGFHAGNDAVNGII